LIALLKEGIKLLRIGFQRLGRRGNIDSLCHLTSLLSPDFITFILSSTNYRYSGELKD